MRLFKFLIPVFVIGLSFTSCKQKDYRCVCVSEGGFCGTGWVQAEIKSKTSMQANAECNSYDMKGEGGSTNCEIE